MSVRRRNIQNRVGAELQRERGRHELTNGLMKVQQDLTRRALDERDKALEECDMARERVQRLLLLAKEIGPYFAPQGVISRDTDLFRLLDELAPMYVPATPKEILESMLEVAGVTLAEVTAAVGYALPTGVKP